MNAPGLFPNEPLYRLQALLWPAPDRPSDLYLTAYGPWEQSAGQILLPTGTQLDFGTWFNSFYQGFWAAHARLGRLALRLRFRGRLRIRVESRRAGERPRILARKEALSYGSPYVLPIPQPGDSGRIAVVLEASEQTSLASVEVCTDTPPAPVRLSIGICTFNREDKLRVTLEALARLRATLPELEEVFLVNQGAPLQDPRTHRAIAASGTRLVSQPNLGGAGGFTRTMVEALTSRRDLTHHLVMDDDIALDERMVARLVEALSHARPDRALGGAMMETERPRILHEAGARLKRGWGVASFGSGRSLGREETLALFDRVEPAHYNGWWFCAVPLATLRQVGLPMPLFIRGDDIEYGCRMGQAGVPSVTLPGCGVWHDAFTGKARPWLTYYDYRNLLVNAALHPQIAGAPRPVEVLGALIARLLCHQYGMAEALRVALSDYLAGPRPLARQPQALRHEQLARRFGEEDGETLPAGVPLPPPWEGPRHPLPPGLHRIALLFIWRIVQISLGLGRTAAPAWTLTLHQINPVACGPGPVIRRADPAGRRCLLLAPSRRQLWRGLAACLAIWLRYLLRYRRVASQWWQGADDLAGPEAWGRRFADVPPGSPPEAGA